MYPNFFLILYVDCLFLTKKKKTLKDECGGASFKIKGEVSI